MSELWKTVVVVALVLTVAACGRGDKEEGETTAQRTEQSADEQPAYASQENPYEGLSPSIRDTLRRQKKLNNVTRDQYWGGIRGGVLGNDYFEVWYPEGRLAVTHAMHVLNLLRPARPAFASYFGSAPTDLLIIRCSRDMDEYRKLTERDWWHYSSMRQDTLTYQPVFVLYKRNLNGLTLDTIAVPHEYYKWALRTLTGERAPRWLEEGVASLLSGEEPILTAQLREFPDHADAMSVDAIEVILATEEDRRDTRVAYYRAYRMVKNLIDEHGDDKLRKFVGELAKGRSLDQASRAIYGGGYADVITMASDYTIDLSSSGM